MDLKIEHTLTIWNDAGAAVFQAEVLVDVEVTADGWKITDIEDEFGNAYNGLFFTACADALEDPDTLFPHAVEAAIRAQRSGQCNNEIYDAKYGN
jgi:hypothetical protein